MLDIGTTDFILDVESLTREKLEQYSTRLFDEWDQFLSMELLLPDYAIRLEIDEGSIKGRGRVLASIAAIYAGVVSYGGFVQGIQGMAATIRTGGAILVDSAAKPFPIPDALKWHRRAPGFPAKIERLFVRVKNAELSPEDATAEVMNWLADEPEVPSILAHEIATSFQSIFIEPQQLTLAFDDVNDDSPYAPDAPQPRKPRRPNDLPPNDRVRVEVWKDSKNGARRVVTLVG